MEPLHGVFPELEHGTRTRSAAVFFAGVNPLHSAKKLPHTHPNDFTFPLAISTFSSKMRSDLTAAAALSSSERLALAAVGRTSRATNDRAAAKFRARIRAGLERSDFAVRRLRLIFVWK